MNVLYFLVSSNFKKLLLLLFLAVSFNGLAQVKDMGIPLIHNFTKEEYKAGAQSWGIVQDSRGILYFANNHGLLEFDGALWRTYTLPNKSAVRSVCLGPGQRVYLAGYNECGYMAPDKFGVLRYNSISKNLGINFGDVWRIFDTKKGIIFQSYNTILLWDGNKMQVLLDSVNLRFSFRVHNNLYVQQKGLGLLKFEGKKFSFVPGSEIFAEREIWSMLPGDRNKIIIGTFNEGLYLLEGRSIKPFECEANDYLKKNQIFSSISAGDGLLAYGTIQNGIFIINEEGGIIQHIDRQKGLQNNTVLALFADANKNLWLGLDNGIDYIETNSPVSHLVKKKEIGAGYCALKFNDYIYYGTNQGLFRKKWSTRENSGGVIEKVENTQGQVWSLYEYKNTLFCGHDKGTFRVNQLNAEKISSVEGVWKFLEVPGYDNVLIQGSYGGMSVLAYENGRWSFRNIVKGFHSSARFIEIDNENNVWISYANGVYRFHLDNKLDSVNFSRFYSYKDGLPPNVNVIKVDKHLLFNTDEGIYQYNSVSDRFEPSPDFYNVFKTRSVNRIFRGFDNLYWFISNSEPGVLLRHLDGRYSVENTPLRKISGSFIKSFEHILQIDAQNVIMSVEDGFMHYNPQFRTNYLQMPKCFIRQVSLANDSVIFGGNDIASGNHINRKIPVSYSRNALKFVFISNSYTDGGKTVFKYMLENFDKSWSDWASQTSKEYTNIPEGTYTFKVLACNIYGIQSAVASYKFIISPPWYRSFYAYLIYIVLIVAVISFWFYRLQNKFEREKLSLKIKQRKILEEKEKQHAQEVLHSQQEIVKLRNEMLELENERSRTEVELKKKELASLATQITRKNEILERIKLQLNKLSGSIKPDDRKKLNAIIKSIDQDIHIDEDWEKFEHYFDQVHGDFIKRLRDRYPALTPTDLKLCAYLKMNISSKEIAPLLNISVRSVEVSRYRLRKKLNLSPTDNLVDFMLSV